MRLFPEGPPVKGRPWAVSTKEDTKAFAKLVRGLFKRNDFGVCSCSNLGV